MDEFVLTFPVYLVSPGPGALMSSRALSQGVEKGINVYTEQLHAERAPADQCERGTGRVVTIETREEFAHRFVPVFREKGYTHVVVDMHDDTRAAVGLSLDEF